MWLELYFGILIDASHVLRFFVWIMPSCRGPSNSIGWSSTHRPVPDESIVSAGSRLRADSTLSIFVSSRGLTNGREATPDPIPCMNREDNTRRGHHDMKTTHPKGYLVAEVLTISQRQRQVSIPSIPVCL